MSLFPDAPCTILSTPIINRLTANRNINNIIPDTGCANTIKDITNDSMPIPIRSALDHFDMYLFVTPCIILAIPITNSPAASKVIKTSVVDNGNARTVKPNPIAMIPNIILLVREDFFRYGSTPAVILSAPAASNVIESRNTRVAIPTPGSISIERDKTIAITPNTICTILMVFGFF